MTRTFLIFHIFQKINIKLDGLDCEFLQYQTNGFIGIGVMNFTEFYFKNFSYFFAYFWKKRMLYPKTHPNDTYIKEY